jgi:tripartite-type tricarboxylate transporter receptor subunit TctC
VPYPSSPQAVTALLRNDVQMACLPAISIMPQLGSGKLKVLAVSTSVRSPLLPDIPTLKEAGIDVEADAWSGLIAPTGMPNPLTERIGRFVGQAVTAAAVRDKLAAQYMTPIPGTPAEFRARIDSDIARWSAVIAAAKIKIE